MGISSGFKRNERFMVDIITRNNANSLIMLRILIFKAGQKYTFSYCAIFKLTCEFRFLRRFIYEV